MMTYLSYLEKKLFRIFINFQYDIKFLKTNLPLICFQELKRKKRRVITKMDFANKIFYVCKIIFAKLRIFLENFEFLKKFSLPKISFCKKEEESFALNKTSFTFN